MTELHKAQWNELELSIWEDVLAVVQMPHGTYLLRAGAPDLYALSDPSLSVLAAVKVPESTLNMVCPAPNGSVYALDDKGKLWLCEADGATQLCDPPKGFGRPSYDSAILVWSPRKKTLLCVTGRSWTFLLAGDQWKRVLSKKPEKIQSPRSVVATDKHVYIAGEEGLWGFSTKDWAVVPWPGEVPDALFALPSGGLGCASGEGISVLNSRRNGWKAPVDAGTLTTVRAVVDGEVFWTRRGEGAAPPAAKADAPASKKKTDASTSKKKKADASASKKKKTDASASKKKTDASASKKKTDASASKKSGSVSAPIPEATSAKPVRRRAKTATSSKAEVSRTDAAPKPPTTTKTETPAKASAKPQTETPPKAPAKPPTETPPKASAKAKAKAETPNRKASPQAERAEATKPRRRSGATTPQRRRRRVVPESAAEVSAPRAETKVAPKPLPPLRVKSKAPSKPVQQSLALPREQSAPPSVPERPPAEPSRRARPVKQQQTRHAVHKTIAVQRRTGQRRLYVPEGRIAYREETWNDKVLEDARASGLGWLGRGLTALIRGGFRLEYSGTPKDELIGESRFGGEPDLPEGSDWPDQRGVPMVFLAQLRLDELSIQSPVIPDRGMFSFFCDAKRPHGRVLYTPPEALLKLVRCATPEQGFELASRGMYLRPSAFLPDFDALETGAKLEELSRESGHPKSRGAMKKNYLRLLHRTRGYSGGFIVGQFLGYSQFQRGEQVPEVLCVDAEAKRFSGRSTRFGYTTRRENHHLQENTAENFLNLLQYSAAEFHEPFKKRACAHTINFLIHQHHVDRRAFERAHTQHPRKDCKPKQSL